MKLLDRIANDPWFYALRVTVLLTVGAILLAFAVSAWAKDVAILQEGGLTVTLTDEPCKLSAVSLKFKAVWKENGKTFQGCWGVNGPIVVAYFADDKSIALFPVQLFRPLVES